jgi:hypothetical protein
LNIDHRVCRAGEKAVRLKPDATTVVEAGFTQPDLLGSDVGQTARGVGFSQTDV